MWNLVIEKHQCYLSVNLIIILYVILNVILEITTRKNNFQCKISLIPNVTSKCKSNSSSKKMEVIVFGKLC